MAEIDPGLSILPHPDVIIRILRFPMKCGKIEGEANAMNQTAERTALLYRQLLDGYPALRLTPDALMARYTTLHLGGPADLLAEPDNEDQLRVLLRSAASLDVPVTVIGHGSNLLVRDGGIPGLVIRMAGGFRGITSAHGMLKAGAGCMLSTLAMAAAENDLGGLAFASGIPGTVGGGVWMNAGAYGGELGQVVTLVEGLRRDGTAVRYTRPEMDFSYRHSRLQGEDTIVTAVTLQLPHARREDILKDMVDLNRARAEKQPLTEPSAGSTFKRPEGAFAAALIDQCGLKGAAVGGAAVSEKHAGFLLNRGGTAEDFLGLMRLVRERVLAETGIAL